MNTEKLENIETRRNFQILINYLLENDSSNLITNFEN